MCFLGALTILFGIVLFVGWIIALINGEGRDYSPDITDFKDVGFIVYDGEYNGEYQSRRWK